MSNAEIKKQLLIAKFMVSMLPQEQQEQVFKMANQIKAIVITNSDIGGVACSIAALEITLENEQEGGAV